MKKALTILALLKKEYPEAGIELRYKSPIQLLVATILSAQCTDKRVNIVTSGLFKKYRTVQDFARADRKTFEQEIRSTGFYRQKAKNIIHSAGKIMNDHGGKVPNTMEELMTLPGVARKTANIVLQGAFGITAGIAVDTHVRRVSGRLGLTRYTDPVKIEQDLMKAMPKKDWEAVSLLLVAHGRAVCHARNPNCPECVLKKLCRAYLKGLV